MLRTERGIVPTFSHNDAQHRCGDSGIMARQRLDENVGIACRFRSARIYDDQLQAPRLGFFQALHRIAGVKRSEEHTSELQSLMRISYAVICLKKTKPTMTITN